MSIMEVTTKISRKWLERKSKCELASIIMNNLDKINLFAERDEGGKSAHDAPLAVNVTGDGRLCVQIGIATLAFACERQEDHNPYNESTGGFKRLYRVTDAVAFAGEVRVELCREEENGATPLTDLLDKACTAAIENGCEGVEEDGRIDPLEEKGEIKP